MVIRLAEMEKLSQTMQQNITSYKAMFEKNNFTMTAMAEHMGDQIFALMGRIDNLDSIGNDKIDCMDTLGREMFVGQERGKNITKVVREIQERMEEERRQLEAEMKDRMGEGISGDEEDSQKMNMVDDIRAILSDHMDNLEVAKQNNHKDVKEILNKIETQEKTMKQMEENTKNFLHQVSELENLAVNITSSKELNGLKSKNENDSSWRLASLESRVDSLTEKVNNFVQNVMTVRSLPQKVMDMQNKLNRLEEKIKG